VSTSAEVVVVGGGPAGSAAAYWLADAGHEVMLVEKSQYPREKTCGDGLTPRAIYELELMGFDFSVPEMHIVHGLRSYGGGRYIEMAFPDHPVYPSFGGVIRRSDLDSQVAGLALARGVEVIDGTRAEALPQSDGRVAVKLIDGGDIRVVEPRLVVIADGAHSRFGRPLGIVRDRRAPYGLALRCYYRSPESKADYLESMLDLTDESGKIVPGYGWVFPLGDGTINVGVGLLSTTKRWKGMKTADLLDLYAHQAPEYWELSSETRVTDPVGGKLSMAFSGGPVAGRNWILVGDALGATNPFTGEGIAYGYETGRLAAGVAHEALVNDDPALLAKYAQRLEDTFGDYYRVGRVFVRAIGNPAIMRTFITAGFRSRPIMEWAFLVMSNLMPPGDKSLNKRVYDVIESAVRTAPAGLGQTRN
jgi:geranylgeranyl reductase family protein